MIEGNKILLINCSYPNYNLAIEKMKIYYGERAIIGRRCDDMFNQDVDVVCLSVIFSWDVPFAVQQAKFALSNSKKVMIGGGGCQQLHNYIKKETGIDPHYQVNQTLENMISNYKMVYFTRGCIENCWFCTVPRIEGHTITLNRESLPAPVLLDNNLSELPQEYQEHIVEKYLISGLKSVDANSGFEPKGINERVVTLFDQLPLRWWRIGFDVIGEESDFIEAIKIIKYFSKKKIRVYSMIGHEPIEVCRYRCEKIIELGCEPVPQPFIRLNAKSKIPALMHDWTLPKLRDFQRFFYCPQLWRKLKLEEYSPRKFQKPLFTSNIISK